MMTIRARRGKVYQSPRMSPQVTAAIIAASVSFLTLIGTLAAQYFGRRATSRDTKETLERTLAEQRSSTFLGEGSAQLLALLRQRRVQRLAPLYGLLAKEAPDRTTTA
jgi:hypothetical protein